LAITPAYDGVDGHPDPRGVDLRVVTENGTTAKLAAAMGPA